MCIRGDVLRGGFSFKTEKNTYIEVMKNLKKEWPKKSAILVLAFTNVVTFAFLINRRSAQAETRPPAIKAVVKPAKRVSDDNALQSCYESFLARGPQIDEGAVVVHWIIDPDGKISSLKLMRTDLQDDDFTSCILDNVKRMTFTPPSKDHATLVAHTFNFKRKTASALEFQ